MICMLMPAVSYPLPLLLPSFPPLFLHQPDPRSIKSTLHAKKYERCQMSGQAKPFPGGEDATVRGEVLLVPRLSQELASHTETCFRHTLRDCGYHDTEIATSS